MMFSFFVCDAVLFVFCFLSVLCVLCVVRVDVQSFLRVCFLVCLLCCEFFNLCFEKVWVAGGELQYIVLCI